MPVIALIVGAADLTPTPHDGRYVKEWTPHVPYGTLAIDSTDNPAQAKVWRDPFEALRERSVISSVEPLRPDKQPNRPLTAINILIEPYQKEEKSA